MLLWYLIHADSSSSSRDTTSRFLWHCSNLGSQSNRIACLLVSNVVDST